MLVQYVVVSICNNTSSTHIKHIKLVGGELSQSLVVELTGTWAVTQNDLVEKAQVSK